MKPNLTVSRHPADRLTRATAGKHSVTVWDLNGKRHIRFDQPVGAGKTWAPVPWDEKPLPESYRGTGLTFPLAIAWPK